jgi:hypothetical protein
LRIIVYHCARSAVNARRGVLLDGTWLSRYNERGRAGSGARLWGYSEYVFWVPWVLRHDKSHSAGLGEAQHGICRMSARWRTVQVVLG